MSKFKLEVQNDEELQILFAVLETAELDSRQYLKSQQPPKNKDHEEALEYWKKRCAVLQEWLGKVKEAKTGEQS